MDIWKTTCETCGRSYEVLADSEGSAILAGEKAHDEEMSKVTQHRCDFGPMMTFATFIASDHSFAPRGW